MTDPAVLRASDVSLLYKGSAEYSLDQLNITIRKNDIYGLLGPNGAGKTSLISILCGVFPPTSGKVDYYNEHGQRMSPPSVRQMIGFVPQEYAFYQELTPLQNLEYFGAMYGLSPRETLLRAQEILMILGLQKVARAPVASFSGGMKRRVNLAIGIIHQPAILILDEPTVGVDVQSRHAIIKHLKQLNSQGTTIVYTSHHLNEAEEICNRIALIDHGKVVAEDTLENLLEKHQKPDLASLFIELTGEAYRD
jgi:ABC-2 type transport system ATP-binding protein